MTWYRSISNGDLILLLLFLGLYGLYFYRMYRIGRILKTAWRELIVKFSLRTIYFILIIIALLGPSFGDTSVEIKSIGKDIIVCVDLSESMNAFDVQPSRLEKVKFELKNVVREFNSDRIGLIIFSSEAFMLCPLSYDQGALNLFIESLSTSMVPGTGTDFGPPLRMAIDKLLSEESTVSQQKSKVIILISDGEDFGESKSGELDKIVDAKVRLYTLGVGSEKGSKIRKGNRFKTDRQGREVISKLQSKELKSMAAKTDGKYFEINGSKNDIDRLINTINKLEGELRDARRVDVSANKYYYFLAIALFFILLDILITVKAIKL